MTGDGPHLVIVGGPNGSGKTTIARELEHAHGLRYLGADDVAEELAPGDWERVRVQAGRLFLARVRAAIAEGRPLLLESTLSGRSLVGLIAGARQAGYRVSIVLVWLESADHCVARVAERVRKGGHNVPEAEVRRRFPRSLANFWHLYRPLADHWQLILNSGEAPLDVAIDKAGEVEVLDEALFARFLKLIGATHD
ncbi:MAG: Zeta toxin family protein [Chromatiaceae bacterium]|nr:MAG: Zeta toxin family protein [Chromatiaceae bacterium]